MRLRVIPTSATPRLAAAVEALGGQALRHDVETLELFYPVEHAAAPDQEAVELTFFVRSWLTAERDVDVELLG
jgi:hypothetical protein